MASWTGINLIHGPQCWIEAHVAQVIYCIVMTAVATWIIVRCGRICDFVRNISCNDEFIFEWEATSGYGICSWKYNRDTVYRQACGGDKGKNYIDYWKPSTITVILMPLPISFYIFMRYPNWSQVGDYKAVIPEITGSAWVTQTCQVFVDPDDPFPEGYTVSDIWS